MQCLITFADLKGPCPRTHRLVRHDCTPTCCWERLMRITRLLRGTLEGSQDARGRPSRGSRPGGPESWRLPCPLEPWEPSC